MKKTIYSLLAFLLLCSLLSFVKPTQLSITLFSGHAMTIDYTISVGESLTASMQRNVEQIIHSCFCEINAVYNQWNPDSEISSLNNLPAHEHVRPSPALYALLTLVDEIVQLTEGRYDPTVEPLTHLWQQALKQNCLPDSKAVAALASSVGWQHIHLENGEFWKSQSGVKINLDSISKGFCVDRLTEQLNAAGFRNVLVEWGGEIRASGHHPEGRPWRVFIRCLNSVSVDDAIAEIDLQDSALATSGDYLQQWTVGDTTYFHILDARAKRPLTVHPGSVASATVMTSRCAVADALATAAICWDQLDRATAWGREVVGERFPGTMFWIAGRD